MRACNLSWSGRWLAGVGAVWFGSHLLLHAAVGLLPNQAGFAITNIAQFQQLTSAEARSSIPVVLEGLVVTVDRSTNRITIKDGTGSIEVQIDPEQRPIPQPGLRIRLQATTGVTNLTRFPDQPTETSLQPAFEAPSNLGCPHVTRMRGWLLPPASGEYTFWVSSDDGSRLLLSSDADPAHAIEIASVTNWNTAPCNWEQQPRQRSAPVALVKDQPYYVEVLHRNGDNADFLAAAWAGPDLERQVIQGRYLAPWTGTNSPESAAGRGGVFRECWRGLNSEFSALTNRPAIPSPPFLSNPWLIPLGEPQVARAIPPQDPMLPEQELDWVEVEGEVVAVSETGDTSWIELSQGGRRMIVVLEHRASAVTVSSLLGAVIRARGLCESVLDGVGRRVAGRLRMRSVADLDLRDGSRVALLRLAQAGSANGALLNGQRVRVLARVTRAEGELVIDDSSSELTGSYSVDGKEWQTVGESVLGLKRTVFAGLAVVSHSNGVPATARFSAMEGFGDKWCSADVGNPIPAGSAELTDGQLVLTGGGEELHVNQQQFHYAYQEMAGDLTVSVRVDALDAVHEWAKAGLVLRESTTETCKYAFITLTAGHGVQFQTGTGLSSPTFDKAIPVKAPCWVRLSRTSPKLRVHLIPGQRSVREGQWIEVVGRLAWRAGASSIEDAFWRSTEENWSQVPSVSLDQILSGEDLSPVGRHLRLHGQVLRVDSDLICLDDQASRVAGWVSSDGTNWQRVGETVMRLKPSFRAGLMATAHNPIARTRAEFSQVRGLGKTWGDLDIGNPSVPGAATFDGQTCVIEAGGLDFYNESQQFHYLHSAAGNTNEWIVRVESIERTDDWAKAGLQLRERLHPESRYAAVMVSAAKGVEFQWRNGESGNSTAFVIPAETPCWIRLTREPATLNVQLAPGQPPPRLGQRVESMGLFQQLPERVLADVIWRPAEPVEAGAVGMPLAAIPDAPVVNTVEELWRLPLAEVGKGYLVRIPAVVTYRSEDSLVVQDATTGIWCQGPSNLLAGVQFGDHVEVEGRSQASGDAPVILMSSITVQGPGMPPAPGSIAGNSHQAGRREAQWVEVRGILRNAGAHSLDLVVEGGTLPAVLAEPLDAIQLRDLPGAAVRIRGVMSSRPGPTWPLLGMHLLVPSGREITVEQSRPADPFLLPTQDIAVISHSAGQGDEIGFVKVAGAVSFSASGVLYVQDATGGIRVFLHDRTGSGQPGDIVEVSGLPRVEDRIPTLKDAVARRQGSGSPVPPVLLERGAVPASGDAFKRVRIEAGFLWQSRIGREHVLQFETGGRVFQAVCPAGAVGEDVAIPPLGSVVALTGVCQFLPSRTGVETGLNPDFEVLLASARDIAVIETPAWWTLKHTLASVGLIGLVLLLASAWIRGLRRTVEQRTAELRGEVEERRLAEVELARERDLLRSLLDNVPDYIYFKDQQSRFIRSSRSHARLFGLEHQDQLLGRSDHDFFTEDHARPAFEGEQRIIRTGEPIIGLLEKETWPDGRESWVLTSKMPFRDAAGRIIGTFGISKDVTELKRAEQEVERVHKELLETSRQAGMAEIATGVLHNVGNVLNSVNISSNLIGEKVRGSRVASVDRLARLFAEQDGQLARFMTEDPRGRQVPAFLKQLAVLLIEEQQAVIAEIKSLQKNVDHIKEIVATQQSYARRAGVLETAQLQDMVEDALRMHLTGYARHGVDVVREFVEVPPVTTDRHKVLQILVNLLTNAKQACDGAHKENKKVTIRIAPLSGDRVQIEVADNGMGISIENLTRVFQHGFTTRKGGHGFGLHSGALAARELGGELSVQSAGEGQGATFRLVLPFQFPDPEAPHKTGTPASEPAAS